MAWRWLMLPLVLLALTPLDAFAQLPVIGGGGSPIGNIGGGAVGGLTGGVTSNIGMPGASAIPEASRNTIIGPSLSVPLDDPFRPSLPAATGTATNTVTNTANGTVGTAGSLPGRVTNGLGNTLNQATRNAPGNSGQRRTSGVPPIGEQRFVGGEVMLRLPSNLTTQQLDDLARRHNLTRVESQRVGLTGTTIHRWRTGDGRSVSDIIRALEAEAGVTSAQPNYRFELAQQPQAHSAATDTAVPQYALTKLSLPQAHRYATGDRVLIAVIDSGIDTKHPEIDGFVVESFDALGSKEPAHSHGTAMAGAIIAHARLTGVAPSARILAIRAFGAAGASAESTTLTLLRAIDWAVAHRARVINMSFAGPSDPELARVLAAARKKGVVLVAAAGNAGASSPPLFPASDTNVIAVTAIDADDKLFAGANRGKHIAIAAPGVDVLAPSTAGRYQTSTGTSIAAAHISGVAALLLERKPDLTPDALRKTLTSTATDLGPKGRDDQFGSGLANAYRAIQSIDAVAARGSTASAAATTPTR